MAATKRTVRRHPPAARCIGRSGSIAHSWQRLPVARARPWPDRTRPGIDAGLRLSLPGSGLLGESARGDPFLLASTAHQDGVGLPGLGISSGTSAKPDDTGRRASSIQRGADRRPALVPSPNGEADVPYDHANETGTTARSAKIMKTATSAAAARAQRPCCASTQGSDEPSAQCSRRG